jgi:hypothetical protein
MKVIIDYEFRDWVVGDCFINITNNKCNLVISHYKENNSISESDKTIFIDKAHIYCIKNVKIRDKIKIYVDNSVCTNDKSSIMEDCSIKFSYEYLYRNSISILTLTNSLMPYIQQY